MFYALNENVYLVKGHYKSCIYDFNSLKLYSINKSLAQKVDLINNGKITTEIIDSELKNIFEQFLRLKLLILSEQPIKRDIEEMKKLDDKCDFAWIEITNKCNLKCIHCYNESDKQKNLIMSIENYKKVIDALLKIGVKKIQIIGGEPFCQKLVLKEMIDYTIGKFNFIEIFTNGTLINDDWINYIAGKNIHIALSVYSYNKNVHDKVTGVIGSWDKTNEVIRKLKEKNIKYRVCNVLMKDVDIGEKITDLYTLSKNNDVVRMSGRANFNLLSDELIKKRLITANKFRKSLNKNFTSQLISGHNCFSNKIYISSDMTVYPCVMERRIKHCNIIKENEIILDENIRSLTKNKFTGCKECEYRYTCFDCRPNSLDGDLFEKPWYCTYNPYTGEWVDEDSFIRNLRNNFIDKLNRKSVKK